MRQEIHRLVEAVRDLQIEPTGQPAPHCVRIGVSKSQLPEKLLAVRQALDGVDASGSLVGSGPDEMAKHREALDGLLRYVKMRGLDFSEAEEIVRTALGKPRQRLTHLKPLPMFAPDGWKKRRKVKLKIKLDREPMTVLEVKDEANQMTWVFNSLAAAAPQAPIPPTPPAVAARS